MLRNKNEQDLLELGLFYFTVITVIFFSIFIYQNGFKKYHEFLGFQSYAAVIWAFFSSFFWLFVIYRLDIYKKERLETIGKLALVTFLITYFITGAINYTIKEYFGMLSSLLAVGFVEEGTKVLMILYFIYNARDFDEPMDGVFYAGVTAVAFSFTENIGYYNMYILQEIMDDKIMVFSLVVRFLTTFFHIAFTSLAGFMLGLYKFGYVGKKEVAIAFIVAAFFHSAYDLLCDEDLVLAFALMAVNGTLFFIAIEYLNQISPYNRNYLFECKKCHYLIRENSVKCPRCSSRTSFIDSIIKNYKIYCSRCQNEVNREDKSCKSCGFEFETTT